MSENGYKKPLLKLKMMPRMNTQVITKVLKITWERQ
jgi:hypothetical protein